MSDIEFEAWGVQENILEDDHRIIGAFAGKRCINPQSTVLTPGGIKEFGDISSSDHLLSFDQKANRFRFSRSGSSFPKTKEIGYRVIHDRGEFVASGRHRIFCSDHRYRSLLEIKNLLSLSASEKEVSFLSHHDSTLGQLQRLFSLDDPHSNQKLSNYQKSYEIECRQYDQQLHCLNLLSCESNILAIERESSEMWFWDVEVPGDNNYVANGAIHHNSGKTEIGAIKSILWQEQKQNYRGNDVDPFLGVIIAPTFDMLRRLSLKKFMIYADPFVKSFNKSTMEITWHDGSQIYGLSADNPERIEGIKAHWVWLDEVFQMSEQLWLEVRARTADTQGKIMATGSLGVQFVNPKQHWVHHYFKEKPDKNTSCYEWATADNPYFPKDEIDTLKDLLDPQTFRSMFEIDWDTQPKTAVYSDFGPDNIISNYIIKPELETYVSIDWGWAHELACCFFQYDRKSGTVYLFDEIIESKMTLERLHKKILSKKYKITGWVCDIAGNQEREQLGLSNVRWFREKHDISFKFRKSAISLGISLVRSFIKNGSGQTKFYVYEGCKKSIDGLKRYKYHEKDGQIVNENPIKKDDDAVDAIRYFFVNICDNRPEGSIESMKVW